MNKISRLFLFGTLILVLLTAACAAEQGTTPTAVGTTVTDEETSTPLATETAGTAETETATTAETATEALETPTASETDAVSTQATADGTAAAAQTAGTPGTPQVPVTGVDIVLVECQFCVDTMAHALLVLPDTATFEITSPPTTTTTSTTSVSATSPNCTTVEVNNGKQVVLCSGPEMTPITLNICTDSLTCTDFPIDLLACPLAQTGTAVPNQTQEPGSTNTPTGPGTGDGDPTTTPTLEITISTPTP